MTALALRETISEAERVQQTFANELVKLPTRPERSKLDPTIPRFRRDGEAFVVEGWTPDKIADRNERLEWLNRNRRHWQLINGQLIPGPHDRGEGILADLGEIMVLQRTEWKQRLRDLDMRGVPTSAEGTYGALGAYPLPAELPSVTPTATEASLITTANLALYMPLPANGILGPQAYRFVVAGRTTPTATAANYTWTPRLGNANTSPSLGASAALAKTISITNAILIWKGDITIQQVGIAGANSKAVGHFGLELNSAAGGAATVWRWGSTASASFDSTVSGSGSANGGIVWLGATASAAAADPFTIGQIHFMDWN